MAPSGAGLPFLGCLFVLVLAARWASAEASGTASADSQCRSLSDGFSTALGSGMQQPTVTLGPGCNILTSNFACTPIQNPLLIVGVDGSDSTWDTEFELYQFSVEPGVVVTLRNLVLARTLVFTSVDSTLKPSTTDPRASLQLSIFHMRPGSSLVLQNVTVQTRCTTLMYYWSKFPGAQKLPLPAGSAVGTPPPLAFPNTTLGAVALQNVTVSCGSELEPTSPVDLFVHTAQMLSAFLGAASALSVTVTVHLAENITLPRVPSTSTGAGADASSPSSLDVWSGSGSGSLVEADTYIVGAGSGWGSSLDAAAPASAGLTFVDANFTASWLTVRWPARLTLQQLVLTRLAASVIVAGGSNGLLAGALPVSMVGVLGAPTQPVRYFKDVTLLVPQYEVTEMSYWCVMFDVGTPELKSVADFLRPYVRLNDFDVVDPHRLILRRVRTASSSFERVLLTSVAPPGVPFDPTAGPPDGAAAYQHVMPPLYFVGSGSEWADAVAPVLPQDTWSSPPPTVTRGSAAPAPAASATSSFSSSSSSSQLPALLLINGTVSLRPSDVRVPGGGMRVVRRSVVITSMRQGCSPSPSPSSNATSSSPSSPNASSSSSSSGCPPAVLDMGGLMNAMRLEGLNTTVVFMGITLRNASTTLGPANAAAAATDENIVKGFFDFDRSAVHVSFESVSVELAPEVFGPLHRFIASRPRSGAGEVGVINITDTLIQLSSFQFGGARGSYVNFTLVPGSNAASLIQPTSGGAGGSGAVVPIVVGTVVGSIGLVLLVVAGAGFMIASHLRLRQRQEVSGDEQKEEASGNTGGEAKRRDSRSTSRSAGAAELSSMEDSGASAAGGAAFSAATNAAAASEPPYACGGRDAKVTAAGGDESPHCTTITMSDLNSSEAATTTTAHLAAMAPVAPPAALQLALVSASGQMPRRAFAVARSVPEDVELGAVEISMEGSSGVCSSWTGGGRRLLMDVTAGGESAAAVAAAAFAGGMRPNHPKLLPSLLDPPADAVSSGGGGDGGGGGGGGGTGGGSATAATPAALALSPSNSGASARRMLRTASAGRSHLYGIGEGGRSAGLRVRALGRSPSRPARSSASTGSSNGPSTTLPAPQPAMLLGSLGPAPPSAAAPGSGSGARLQRGERAVYHYQLHHLRGGVQRREMSQPALAGGGGAAAAAALIDPPLGPAPSGGGGAACYAGSGVDDSGGVTGSSTPSPGASTSISKVPEPASEVQRLIAELSTHGTDQLVILEPIGQGGYGTVYRGVWRNLDVAVKTVLFQDRANLTPPPSCCPPGGPAPVSASAGCTQNGAIIQTTVIEEDDEADGSGDGGVCGSSRTAQQQKQQQQQQQRATPNGGGGPAAATALAAAIASAPESHTSNGGGGGGGGWGGGGTGTGTHNWALASQQAANSGSLPSVNVGAVGVPANGPLGLGVASQQRAVLEAAVSCTVAHPNVVATYHYDITPIPRPAGVVCSGGLLVSDIGGGSAVLGPGGGGPAMGASGTAGTVGVVGPISDWKLYLVQEFCDAGSLANALDARAFHDPAGMPNLALTLCALADVARGMAHIHSRSIVHGDLNPTNILLRSFNGSNGGIVPMWNRVPLGGPGGGPGGGGPAASGSGSMTPGGGNAGPATSSGGNAAANLRHELGVTLVAKVADFGLCGMLAPGKRHISNALRGTPFYTAPETVATGTLTKASDVFSFGVIAWEVYTGRPPFQHVPDTGFVRDESFPRLPPHVPATFANMTLACVNADPEARPTFDQILERLMSLQSKLAVSLQQRLSRLMGVGPGALLGAASPLGPGPGTAASTPHGATTPTAGFGGGGQPAGSVGALLYGATGAGGQATSGSAPMMPPQTVCCAGVARGMAGANPLAGFGGAGDSPGLLAGGAGGAGAGVPNFPLSMPCVLTDGGAGAGVALSAANASAAAAASQHVTAAVAAEAGVGR